MWEKFMDKLREVSPPTPGEDIINFLGSVKRYKKVFMEANASS